MKIKLLVTSDCDAQCPHCSVRPWMLRHNGYHMSMDEVQKFIDVSKKSGYEYDSIPLLGGEPMIWDNILNGIRLLKSSGITKKIKITTNGLTFIEKYKVRNDNILQLIDNLTFSLYHGNAKNLQFIYDNHREYLDKIKVYNGTERFINPVKPMRQSRPAKCACKGYTVFDDKVGFCSPAITMCVDDNLWVPLRPGFIEDVENIKGKYKWRSCTLCIGNVKVRKRCNKVKNILVI
jgi:organic radical activating enzyme